MGLASNEPVALLLRMQTKRHLRAFVLQAWPAFLSVCRRLVWIEYNEGSTSTSSPPCYSSFGKFDTLLMIEGDSRS
jgi:hypothetical protein